MEFCESYVGAACVDGSCPIANREDYGEYCAVRGIDRFGICKNCWMYKGCDDCALYGTELCARADEK